MKQELKQAKLYLDAYVNKNGKEYNVIKIEYDGVEYKMLFIDQDGAFKVLLARDGYKLV